MEYEPGRRFFVSSIQTPLLGGKPTSLKNMTSAALGIIIHDCQFNEKNIIFFQSTNQIPSGKLT